MLLTYQEIEEKKKLARESEIRQNIKSHCTRIRDGIRKNGSTSGNRAIWELFQNAGDLAECAEIKITLTNERFIFAHKGESFTFDSLCSLVKQVSSQEKEDDIKVGQYGTGFLTTHKFSRKIIVNGSMRISDKNEPEVYVDIDRFVIDRSNFDDIPLFIEDMKNQILAVEELMDHDLLSYHREWTELCYELNDERRNIVQMAIDEAIQLLPFVMAINDNIGSCTIIDETRNKNTTFTKRKGETSNPDLHLTIISNSVNGKEQDDINVYYLELHSGDSRIILPLKNEQEVMELGDVPRLFVHFPLIGQNHYNVQFIFHSHRFTPEEARDNIILPKDNDATEKAATENIEVLGEMTNHLWDYLEKNVIKWENTVLMARIGIKDTGYDDEKTEAFYLDQKKKWVNTFSTFELIEVDGNRYSISAIPHPVVLEPTLCQFIIDNEEKEYLSEIYDYAKNVALIPAKDELVQWSIIIAEWCSTQKELFMPFEDIVSYISKNCGENLKAILKMIVDAGYSHFFELYPLLPNREHLLLKRAELRDAESINEDLYQLVKALSPEICKKMIHQDYADFIELPSYSWQNLRDELNDCVKDVENSHWKRSDHPGPYSGDFEYNLIKLCSFFTTTGGDSKRNRLMPIICAFENIEYQEINIPAWRDNPSGFELHRQIFPSLVENQMMKISEKDSKWVSEHINDLASFVDFARGDDYKSFCTRYAIYPDMLGMLHCPDDLKKNVKVNDILFNLYSSTLGEDLRGKCVNSKFELFFDKYAEDTYQFTPTSVANEIQNELSAGNYQDTILLDIIDLTEQEGVKGTEWQLLFKDIYKQRESIRYRLGSDEERKAINRMMKRKSPELLQLLADVAERKDSDTLIGALNEAIANVEHQEHIKKLGAFVESHVERFIADFLKPYGVSVKNEQGGQDLILSKTGFEDYYIEIKSRWVDKASAVMSSTQYQNAVSNPTRYSLISAQMWTFEQKRVEAAEDVSFEEFEPLLKVCEHIGAIDPNLLTKLNTAFKYQESEISAVGSYEVHVPQKIITQPFMAFIDNLKEYFS